MTKDIKILYFAWLRQMIGLTEEQLVIPSSVHSVNDVIDYLIQQGAPYDKAFEVREVVCVALDHHYVDGDHPIGEAKEIAFFPPVTGG